MNRLVITPAEEKIVELVIGLRLALEYGNDQKPFHSDVACLVLSDLETCGLIKRPKYLPKELALHPHYDGEAELISERPDDEEPTI